MKLIFNSEMMIIDLQLLFCLMFTYSFIVFSDALSAWGGGGGSIYFFVKN